MKKSVLPIGDIRKTAWMERKGLQGLLKPLLWCLKVTGLLHGIELRKPKPKENDPEEEPNIHVVENRRRCSIYLAYSVSVNILLLANFGNSLTVFKGATSFNGHVCNQIITATWFLQVLLFALNNITGCRYWELVFKKWDAQAKMLDIEKDKNIRRGAVIASVVYVSWIIASMLFTSIGALFITDQVAVFTNGEAGGVTIFLVFLVVYFYFASVWYLLTASFVVTCFAIYTVFRRFNRKFNNAISADGKFNGDLEEYRLQHEDLLQLLRTADDIFSMYILVAIATIIPLIIFTLYFVLFKSVDLYSYVATWWSVSLSLIQITVVFIAGGVVNHVVSIHATNLSRRKNLLFVSLSINNPDFENYLGQMYPPELEIKDTTESNTSASYLDLLLSIGRDGQLHTSLYDKRDDFNFHITNFPFLSSNIPSSPAYGVFISQLIRYARASSSYECFILRAVRLSNKLLGQGYVMERLRSSLRKFYGRYGDLIKQYEVPLSRMLHDILDDDHLQ